MMASGENLFIATTMRRMPVLAQGQTSQNQMSDNQSNDDLSPVQISPNAVYLPGAPTTGSTVNGPASNYGGLTPEQIQAANDAWEDVVNAQNNATAAWSEQNWQGYASAMAQAAAFMQNYYSALGITASPNSTPNIPDER